jgi:hypothetical protein
MSGAGCDRPGEPTMWVWRALQITWRIAWRIVELAIIVYVLGAIRDPNTSLIVGYADDKEFQPWIGRSEDDATVTVSQA